MSGVRRTAADAEFSKAIRLRAQYQCEYCGAQHAENSQGLHCSHYIGRRNRSVRYEPLNAAALCFSCHNHMASYPHEHAQWFQARGNFDVLLEMARVQFRDRAGVKYCRTVDREIAKHYRNQMAVMRGQILSHQQPRLVGWI